MSQPIKLLISSHPKYLGLMLKVLQELLNYNEVPDETARRLILCVDEEPASMLSNKGMEAPARNPARQHFISMTMISQCR
jgi:hypothetical protein